MPFHQETIILWNLFWNAGSCVKNSNIVTFVGVDPVFKVLCIEIAKKTAKIILLQFVTGGQPYEQSNEERFPQTFVFVLYADSC